MIVSTSKFEPMFRKCITILQIPKGKKLVTCDVCKIVSMAFILPVIKPIPVHKNMFSALGKINYLGVIHKVRTHGGGGGVRTLWMTIHKVRTLRTYFMDDPLLVPRLALIRRRGTNKIVQGQWPSFLKVNMSTI